MSKPLPTAPIGADPGDLTILRALDHRRLATKTYAVSSNGRVVRQEFSGSEKFSAELVLVDGIEGLHRQLRDLETDQRAFVIRGAPKATTDLQRTSRTLRKDGGAFMDVPRTWFMVDADKIPLPAGYSVIDDPADVARYLVDLFAGFAPELEGVSVVVQFSSSAGIGEQAEAELAAGMPERWGDLAKRDHVSAHLWFWLAAPQDSAALKRWAEAINAVAENKVIDPALMNAIQAHYTAAPVFGTGLHDPLLGRRTVLVRGATDAVTLDIPADAPRPAYTSGDNAVTGLGFAARLALIGHPEHGFHGPVNSAIASYIATNWPHPDEETLIELLQARILAADPGARSNSEIARYADADNLRQRITWTMDRQREKADAERAARAVAEAVAPTFPDKGVTLVEGRRLAAEAVDRFAAQVRAGERPELLLQMTVGGGKTEAAIQGAVKLLEAGRAGGGDLARDHELVVLVPRHDLGGQIVERIAKAHPSRTIAVWRGMNASDPERPGKAMCLDPDLPKAAAEAGLGQTDVCVACPLNTSCGYQRQRSQRADIWIGAHQLAFQDKPKPIRGAAVAVIDEGFWSAAITGQDGHEPQLALSAIEDDRTGRMTGIMRQLLHYHRGRAARVLRRHEQGGLLRAAFEDEGFTAEGAAEWKTLEWETKPKVTIKDGMPRAAILAALHDAAGEGFTRLRPLLAQYVHELLTGTAARSVNTTFIPNADLGRGQGSGPAVRFAWRKEFAEWLAAAPKLFLDATTAPEVLRAWAPKMEIAEIEISAPHQRVRQAIGREFGRTFFTQNTGNVKRLADLVIAELAEAAGGEVLVVTQQTVEAALSTELKRRLPNNLKRLHLAHHGALTGMNTWQDVARVVVVGRPAVNRLAGERLAEIVRGGPVDRVQAGEIAHWSRVRAGVRRADGSGAAIEQHHHPDPLVEALRWSITEGNVLQAIGRARGVRRAEAVTITLLGNMALPLTVAEITAWEDLVPDHLTVAAAEAMLAGRALPLAPADMTTARPDLWPSRKAAERFLEDRRVETPQLLIRDSYKELGGFARHPLARYRKGPNGGRWSMALVPIEGGEAALAAIVGPLAAFELVLPPQAAAAAPATLPGVPQAIEAELAGAGQREVRVLVMGVEAELVGATRARVFIMGVDPPFDLPHPPAVPPERSLPLMAVPPASVPPDALTRLRLAAARLEAVRPPLMWGDWTDQMRVDAWRDRCAAARARYPQDHQDHHLHAPPQQTSA